jgi:prepilin-type N-terminal cleavage/methylation domain-containing protein
MKSALERRRAFTLLELILAIALSAILLVLIGTSINLYLVQADASRTLVEEAQLARNVLEMIAEDLRQSVVYRPQDTSAMAELASQFEEQDVDEITSSAGGSGGSGASGFGSASASSSGSGSTISQEDLPAPHGIQGGLEEIIIDSHRLPRIDSWLTRVGSDIYEPMPAGVLWSDVKTVRYIVRPGQRIAAGDVAATRLSPPTREVYGGLVRQEIDRTARVWAEEVSNRTYLDSGMQLVAPEVIAISFRYFDGVDVFETWDMTEMNGLPKAVEIRIWVQWLEGDNATDSTVYNASSLPPNAREYRMIVAVPMGGVSASSTGAGLEEEP